MRNPPVRRFGIADGLILVAATAIGLAATRFVFTHPDAQTQVGNMSDLISRLHSSWTLSDILELIVLAGLLVSPCLIAWTLACLVLRWRGPRPVRRPPRPSSCRRTPPPTSRPGGTAG